MATVTRELVNKELDKAVFMVIGMVNADGHGRTAGVTPVFHDGVIWFGTLEHEWKARHVRGNPDVSVTVTSPRRLPFLPIRIPDATITFTGRADIRALDDPAVPEPVRDELLGVSAPEDTPKGSLVAGRIVPTGDFVTYGIGIPVWKMTDTELARGRVPHRPADRTPATA